MDVIEETELGLVILEKQSDLFGHIDDVTSRAAHQGISEDVLIEDESPTDEGHSVNS